MFRTIDCNDVQLVKRLLPLITFGFSRNIVWKLSADKVTAGLIKWAWEKWNIIVEIKGSISDNKMERIYKYLMDNKIVDVRRITSIIIGLGDNPIEQQNKGE